MRRGRGALMAGSALALGVALVGLSAPVAVAGATTGTTGPTTSTTLTVPTADGHQGRHGAVPRRTTDVAGVEALGHAVPAALAARRASPASRKLLTYGGGLTAGGLTAAGVTTGQPKVYLVFMGDQWGTRGTNGAGQTTFSGDPDGFAPALQTLFAGLGTDSETWSGILTQYCDGAAVGATTCQQGDAMVPHPTPGVLAGIWYDNSGTASAQESAGLSELQIATEAEAAATHFGNTDQASNRDTQYVVVSPTGTDPDGWNNPATGYCAYHDDSHDASFGGSSALGPIIAFTNMPYVSDAGVICGSGSVNSPGVLDGATEAASHEYAETVTDQFPEGTSTVPGWINAGGSEIGDLCAYVSTGPGAAFNLHLATGTVAVQGLWSNQANGGTGSCEDGESDYVFVPSLTSVTPLVATAGSTVTLTGANLLGATSVTFAGTAASITGNTATSVTVLVPAGAANGVVSVTTPLGTASGAKAFDLAPSISSVSPTSVARGQSVTITGSGLGSPKKVTIGGKKAVVTSDSPSQIVATVPLRASSGAVTVASKYGSATAATPLTIT